MADLATSKETHLLPWQVQELRDEIIRLRAENKWLRARHLHTDECLEYAARTGKAYCIASCADARGGPHRGEEKDGHLELCRQWACEEPMDTEEDAPTCSICGSREFVSIFADGHFGRAGTKCAVCGEYLKEDAP